MEEFFMDYKSTLNLPKTEFPMKANLSKKEPEILKKWKKNYKKILHRENIQGKFILHDGPPYANGNIHIGHALNKILKDVIVKYKLLTGKGIHFVPGWDCHGLPIERQVEKELNKMGKRKEDIPKPEFRKLCRDYAMKYVNIQREEFIRLGVLADWDNPYLTMDPSYEAQEVRELARFFKKGLVYRRKKPVYWCIYDTTAEAEAEVEYGEREDPSIYVAFPLKEDQRVRLLIWTTTPWTLPANLGVMVGEDFTYVEAEAGDAVYILAKELLRDFEEKTGMGLKILREFKGSELVGKEYVHPFVEKDSLKGYLGEETLSNLWKVYPSEFVDISTGTGLVHMAPGHGNEDYAVGLRFGLEPYVPVDDRGYFIKPAPEFIRGKRVFEANDLIIGKLRERGFLVHEEKVVHSYPHCWRCKNPVIFRATDQWFISMEGMVNGKTLREKALEEIEGVNWHPSSGKIRIRSMVEGRPDWCISRQRVWGVPITVFYCKDCGQTVADEEVFERVAELFEKNDRGSDLWFELRAEEILPEGYRCKNCGSRNFEKEEDILDVWFDSGCSHACVLRKEGVEQADLYLEGSDQHRGWFQASLLESVGSYGKAPYREVLTHGFTVDEKGRKMSKSLGNVVSPQEVIEEFGADILRLWVVSEDYTEDVKLGRGIMKNIVEDYKKIRNTIRFMLGNLYDFEPSTSVDLKELHHFDRWIISKLQRILGEIHLYYKRYTFHRVYHKIRDFCTSDLSSIYLDVLKDRLYVYHPSSFERRSAQTALYNLLRALIPSIAPFLSFTAEEAWEHLRRSDPSLPESVFLSDIPEPDENLIDRDLERDYHHMLELRDEVMKALEVAKREGVIRHPYEAKVIIVGHPRMDIIQKYTDYLNFFLTVSQIEVMDGKKELGIYVEKAEGRKCPRCWIYYPEEKFRGDVCDRCCSVLETIRY
jgi:isoleucyl-tRNA synthetase